MAKTKVRLAAEKAARTRRKNQRRTVADVPVGKRKQFVLKVRTTRFGVQVTVKVAPGWQVVPR
jgi:hypothetical protein